MKINYKFITVVVLAAIVLTSCKRELLTPIPQTSIADVSSFSTVPRVQGQLLSLYGALKGGNFYGGRYVIYGEIKGDDFINETSNLVTGSDVWNLNPTNSASSVLGLWGQAYFTINVCNIFLDGMATKGSAIVGATLASNYVAEAKLIRAISYYSLLQYYARPFADGLGAKPGVPLRLTGIKGGGESNIARNTVAEVYTQILKDLNEAEAGLPLNYTGSDNTTRAHRNTAIALKTRVYLTMQQYANVVTEANKIVSANAPFSAGTGVAHALQANIATVFSNYTTTESIFSMPMTSTEGDNPGTQNQLGYYFAKTSGNAEYSLNANGIVADAKWLSTDKRRSFIATFAGKQFLNSKYPTAAPFTDYVPVIRYAEVLLNLAEAKARVSGIIDLQSVALLNAVRNRSDATTTFNVVSFATSTELINAILKERRIEFLGEGLRNNDIMRLLQTIPAKGSAQSKLPSDVGYIWPISATELSLNKLCTDN